MENGFTIGSFGTNVSAKLKPAAADNTRVNTTAIKQYGTGLAGILPKPQGDQAANVALSQDIKKNIAAREINAAAESRGVTPPPKAAMDKLTALSANYAANNRGSLSANGPSGDRVVANNIRNLIPSAPQSAYRKGA